MGMEQLRFLPKKVDRWKRQINTQYNDLSDAEKVSDIEQVEKVIFVVRDFSNQRTSD
jgi:hypothetical protein